MMKSFLSFVNYSRIGLNRMCYSCRTKNYGSDYTLLSARGKSATPNVFIKNGFSNFSNGGNDSEKTKDAVSGEIGGSVTQSGKYELFKDENAPLILDVIEERQRIQELDETEDEYDEFAGINLERGLTGVFDLEDLIFLLQRENAKDIFVASIPPHLQYVDYIVVVTGRSLKHMVALAEFVRRVYKKKRHGGDLIPKIEGETSKDWLAIDLGNIALHILSSSARPIYDIESLWSVGKEFDEKSNSSADLLNELLRKHEISLDDFQPADTLR